MSDSERERAIQSNDVAGVVIEVGAEQMPGAFIHLGFRYGIADRLWAAGYRKVGAATETTKPAGFTCDLRITCARCGHTVCANPEHPEHAADPHDAMNAHKAAEHGLTPEGGK